MSLETPTLSDELLTDPINKNNIHVLIETILGNIRGEHRDDWERRVISYARELRRELYG